MKYEFIPIKANCPICRWYEGKRLYCVSSSESASHFVPEKNDPERHQRLKDHIEKLWCREVCDVIQCCNCGFCYAWPFRAGDATFYDLAYERTGYPAWKWEHQQTLESIRNDVLVDSCDSPRILEIGAGDGAFIKGILPEVTTYDRMIATEYSPFGINQIRNLGISCYDKDIRELFPKGIEDPFHIICMFQVLEHQDQLDRLFETITRVCTSNAHLYISVPNQKFIEFIETNDSLLDMPPNHTGRWNANCFWIIGRRHGWHLISHKVDTSESFFLRARKYAIYRYMRQSQYKRTLASSAQRLRSNRMRKLIQSLLVLKYSMSKLPAFYRLLSGEYASAQWVHLARWSS